MSEPLRIFWGESHHNIYVRDNTDVDLDAVFCGARDHLDFTTAAYYTPLLYYYKPEEIPAGQSGFRLEAWKSKGRIAREWALVQEATRQYNQPGAFVTFPGYEWQGDSSSGDHNVAFRREGGEVYCVNTLAELYDCLRGQDVVAIPHHTAYLTGMRGKDWSVHDEAMSPYAELFSCHGCSESDETYVGMWQNRHMGPGLAGGTYEDALRRGLHIGAIASGDTFGAWGVSGTFGTGLMAALASDLTRDGIWEALKARRVYGVSGDRIQLDFRVDGHPMGQIIEADGPCQIEVGVLGLDAIDRIELLRDGRVIATHCHQGTWEQPKPGQRSRYCLRLEAGWGPDPDEIETSDHYWDGQLTVENGRILDVVPCWTTAGQTPATIKGRSARFGMRTDPARIAQPWQNANVFVVEGAPEDRVHLELNGRQLEATLAECLQGSQLIWYREECVERLRKLRGLQPEECERDDTYYHLAYKCKLHRAMPESAYRAELTLRDDRPFEREGFYRVRVEQRNGQRAWSSPIWVRPKR